MKPLGGDLLYDDLYLLGRLSLQATQKPETLDPTPFKPAKPNLQTLITNPS